MLIIKKMCERTVARLRRFVFTAKKVKFFFIALAGIRTHDCQVIAVCFCQLCHSVLNDCQWNCDICQLNFNSQHWHSGTQYFALNLSFNFSFNSIRFQCWIQNFQMTWSRPHTYTEIFFFIFLNDSWQISALWHSTNFKLWQIGLFSALQNSFSTFSALYQLLQFYIYIF